jgi:hypothetical protein
VRWIDRLNFEATICVTLLLPMFKEWLSVDNSRHHLGICIAILQVLSALSHEGEWNTDFQFYIIVVKLTTIATLALYKNCFTRYIH